MTREELDILWQKALHQSVKDGEQFTRYHFAALVAERERDGNKELFIARAIEAAVLERLTKVDVEPDTNKRKAERLVRMLTDGYSGMKAVREVIALLEQWPDSPASALAALKQENERLTETIDQITAAMGNERLSHFIEKHGEPVPIVMERDALRAQLEAAQADAAKLREALEKCVGVLEKAENDMTYHGVVNVDALDAAINAARAGLETKT